MIGQPDRDAGERDDDRQHHRQHRSERDEQDEDRGEDADALARRRRRALRLLDELTAEPHLELRCRVPFSASVIICLPTESGMSCDLASSCAFASATVPDFEMLPGVVSGSLTAVTCCTRPSAAMNDRACCSTAASCIDGVPFITTCTPSPDCALKLAASRFDARVDSVFGALKFVVKFVPIAAESTFTPTSATSQNTTTRRRRR